MLVSRDHVIECGEGIGMLEAVVLLELLRFLAVFIQAVRFEVHDLYFIHRITPFPGLLGQEAGTIIDLDYTAIFRQCFDHFIAHVALKARCEMPRRRVRGNDRRLADFKNLVKGFIAHMGNVDHDAHTVHFGDHLFAERTQAVPFSFLVVGRIGNMITQCMRQGDVADATVMEKCQVFQLAVDWRAVFHAHRQAYQAVFHGARGLGRGFNNDKIIRRTAHYCLDAINQLVGQRITGSLFFCFRRRVNGHERDIQATTAGTNVIKISPLGTLRYIHPFFPHAIRDIDVRINNDCSLSKQVGGRREIRFFRCNRCGSDPCHQQHQTPFQIHVFLHNWGSLTSPHDSLFPSGRISLSNM